MLLSDFFDPVTSVRKPDPQFLGLPVYMCHGLSLIPKLFINTLFTQNSEYK